MDYSNLTHRMDNRTEEEFRKIMKNFGKSEPLWCNIFKHEEKLRGFEVKIILKGIDPDGKFIPGYVGAQPDVFIEINNNSWTFKTYLEVKTALPFSKVIERVKFISYKTSDFNTYLKWNSYVLTVNPGWYMVISPKGIRYLLNNFEAKIHPAFSPNDLAIRVYSENIKKLRELKIMQFKYWSQPTLELIKKYENDLQIPRWQSKNL